MAYLNRKQVEDVVNGRPEGSTPDQVVNALVSQGHELEGYSSNAPVSVGQSGQQAFQSNAPRKQPEIGPMAPIKNTYNALSDAAARQQQTNAQGKQDWNVASGLQNPVGWFTEEIPTVAANLFKGAEKVVGNAWETSKNAMGIAENFVTGKQINPDATEKFLSSASDAWGGALDILGSPMPLLPDFIEKPVAHVFSAGMDTVKTGENIVLDMFHVPQDSQLHQAITKLTEVGINTYAMTRGGKGKSNVEKPIESNIPLERAQRAQQAFQETGVTPTPSMISNNPVLTQLEALSAQGVFGNKLTKQIQEAGHKIETLVKSTIEEKGKSLDEADIGRNIHTQFNKIKDTHENVMHDLFDSFQEQYAGTPASTSKILEAASGAKDLIDKSMVGASNPMASLVRTILNNAQKGQTFDSLKATRTDLGKRLETLNGASPDPIVGSNVGLAKNLYRALTEDMIGTVNAVNPSAGARLTELNSYYGKKLNEFNSHYGESIMSAANMKDRKSYEGIIDNLVTKNNYSQLPALKNVMGKEGMDFVQAGFLAKLLRESTNGEGVFSPAKFSEKLHGYGDNVLRNLFDDKGYYLLNNLKVIGQRTKPLQKVMEGSQTGFLQRAKDTIMTPTAGALFGQNVGIGALAGALIPLVTDYGASKFLTSKLGRDVVSGTYFKKMSETAQSAKKLVESVPEPIKELARKGTSIAKTINKYSPSQRVNQQNQPVNNPTF